MSNSETLLFALICLPCLIAIREGAIRTTCPQLSSLSHGNNGIDVHAVESWLDQAGVLLDRPPPMEELCLIQPEQEALMDAMGMSAATTQVKEERYDCGLEGCSKSYFHEHVGVTTSEQSGLVVPPEEVLVEP